MDVQTIPRKKPCRVCAGVIGNYRGDCVNCKRTYASKKYTPTPKISPLEGLTLEQRDERKRAYNTEYYRKNKERHAALGSEWQKANRERANAIRKKWRDANKDKQREAVNRWRDANFTRDSENKKRWNRENAEHKRILTNNRRHRIRGKLSVNIIDLLMERQNGLCACCAADLMVTGYHVDHIRPISRGGLNMDFNVQLLTPDCNLRKSDKWET